MNDQVSSRDGSPKRGRCSCSGRPSPSRGSWVANMKASEEPEERTRNASRGPARWDTTAPTNSPLTGPAAMIARILPLRFAAPVGSAVARAWVAMFIAANDKPHNSRAASNAQTPDNVAYPTVDNSEPSAASRHAAYGPRSAYKRATQP